VLYSCPEDSEHKGKKIMKSEVKKGYELAVLFENENKSGKPTKIKSLSN
jgi:hypothetical protein